MLQFLRTVALILLIVVGVSDPKKITFTMKKEWLYLISVLILLTLIFVDSITAFIFTFVIIVIYIKLNDIKFPTKNTNQNTLTFDTIAETNLSDAQTNAVISEKNKEAYKGIKGVYGEEVYSVQGHVSELSDVYYDNEDIFSTSL